MLADMTRSAQAIVPAARNCGEGRVGSRLRWQRLLIAVSIFNSDAFNF
jgi:hypothetical protein